MFWPRLAHCILFFACFAITEAAIATEPLLDQYTTGGKTGRIFPSECCWMQLPPSERLTAFKKANAGCSAIGGAVGKFELASGKLWLTSLTTCSGDVPLHDVYPALESPALATWLTGTFTARIGFVCYDRNFQRVDATTQILTVAQGLVTSLTETANDLSVCPENPVR